MFPRTRTFRFHSKNSTSRKDALEELRSGLDELLGIVLYGCVARGEADRQSDVDLRVIVSENRAQSQRTVNNIELNLEEPSYDNDRYSNDIDVEVDYSVPRYTDNIREIVLSGIPVYEMKQFEKVQKLLYNEMN